MAIRENILLEEPSNRPQLPSRDPPGLVHDNNHHGHAHNTPRRFWGCLICVLIIFAICIYFFNPFHSSTSRIEKPLEIESSKCSMGYTYFKLTGYCYKASITPSLFSEAEALCQADDAHLTSLHSEIESIFVSGLYHQAYLDSGTRTKTSIWIGLHRNEETWEWLDGSPMDFEYWHAKNDPGNATKQSGAISHSSIQWLRIDGTSLKYGFVCKKTPDGGKLDPEPEPVAVSSREKCIVGYSWIEPIRHCYWIVFDKLSFANAEKSCKENNGNLASIHSKLEKILLAGLVMKMYGDNKLDESDDEGTFWIGLRIKDRRYTWTDGTAVDFYDWKIKEPVYTKGKDMFLWTYFYAWQPAEPLAKNGYICKMEGKS